MSSELDQSKLHIPTQEEQLAQNARVIDAFRADPDGYAAPYPFVLLHHTGRKSGREHVTPLSYLDDDGCYVIIGANHGLDNDPQWVLNLDVNPRTTIEIGSRTIEVTARIATGAKRDELAARIFADPVTGPYRAEYLKRTTRQFPIVILEPDRA